MSPLTSQADSGLLVTSHFAFSFSIQNNNPHEWLQVDLGKVRRITGVVTQGARSLMTPMMVTEFSVTISHDKHSWSSVLEENSQREKVLFLVTVQYNLEDFLTRVRFHPCPFFYCFFSSTLTFYFARSSWETMTQMRKRWLCSIHLCLADSSASTLWVGSMTSPCV